MGARSFAECPCGYPSHGGRERDCALSVRVVSPLNKVIFRRVRIAAIATTTASTAEREQGTWRGRGMETDTICQITEGESRVEALYRVWPDKLIAKESDV